MENSCESGTHSTHDPWQLLDEEPDRLWSFLALISRSTSEECKFGLKLSSQMLLWLMKSKHVSVLALIYSCSFSMFVCFFYIITTILPFTSIWHGNSSKNCWVICTLFKKEEFMSVGHSCSVYNSSISFVMKTSNRYAFFQCIPVSGLLLHTCFSNMNSQRSCFCFLHGFTVLIFQQSFMERITTPPYLVPSPFHSVLWCVLPHSTRMVTVSCYKQGEWSLER